MRCFVVTAHEVRSGVPIQRVPYPHVWVGEQGRGRSLVRVPIGRRFADSLDGPTIDRATPIRTRERGTLLLVESRSVVPSDRALVLVSIGAGYRGATEWTRLSVGDGGVYESWDADLAGVRVLAEGWCAQGAAGRMGGHVERLVIMRPGSSIRVVRRGRLYGAPAERIIHWDGHDLRFGSLDEVWPPSDWDEVGEEIA